MKAHKQVKEVLKSLRRVTGRARSVRADVVYPAELAAPPGSLPLRDAPVALLAVRAGSARVEVTSGPIIRREVLVLELEYHAVGQRLLTEVHRSTTCRWSPRP